MRLIDEQFLKTPVYGSRRMTAHLQRTGHGVNRTAQSSMVHGHHLSAVGTRV
ncbi:MAG: transposase, partial [Magnetococcales bacterium]|nr:transposase [Magnetococcales bacterium]